MKTLLRGPAGTGKTTHGVARLRELNTSTYDGILVYVPQKTLAKPYYDATRDLIGNQPAILTIGGLSFQMVSLFWPIVSAGVGFSSPERAPTFLNLETAQYFMAKVIEPLRNEGLFNSVTLQPNRIYTQILDNLNKAALNGYDLELLGERLKLGDIGDPEQMRIYDDALIAAKAFRAYCLKHCLIDFSLQVEIFHKFLWPPGGAGRTFLFHEYRHLIVDNLEETTPVEHDILRDWLPELESAFFIFDDQAGYRTFLGADPSSAAEFTHLVDEVIILDQAVQPNLVLENVTHRVGAALKRPGALQKLTVMTAKTLSTNLQVDVSRYFPEMLDRAAERIIDLLRAGVAPSEIAVLSPYLSDALRYSLTQKLELYDVPVRSHRPSRSLREEPVSLALITLARIANPDWHLSPTGYELAYCFLQLFEGIDLVRAQLLAEAVYSERSPDPQLLPFGQVSLDKRERITYILGKKYDLLRGWLTAHRDGEVIPLDHFLSRLFGEVLSQPGFSFHSTLSAGEITANLIESIQNFRWMNEGIVTDFVQIGREYVHLMQEGVIAAQYARSWQELEDEAVLLAPAYTFLMRNKSVDYQLWLDLGSRGWHERVYQPITHPYVLNRNWPINRYWTDMDEVEQERESLYRLVSGLFRRCKKKVFLSICELSEAGYENEGLLIRVIQSVYQGISIQGRGRK